MRALNGSVRDCLRLRNDPLRHSLRVLLLGFGADERTLHCVKVLAQRHRRDQAREFERRDLQA